jgi:aldehyde:ferredoxin oxidoreductase
MNGYFGKLLRIDLSKHNFTYEDIPDAVLATSLGGKGLGTHLLLQENPTGVAPFSPESRFIITTGPATGTRLWSQSRFGVFAKSPATGGYGESYCGGAMAPRIKGCGVDAVILQGRCDKLTALVVSEAGVEFIDASEIKGRDSFETEDFVLRRSADGAVAMSIGPAGENGVAFACVKSERWRSLGRGGMGAVLGSKNVKALSFSGRQKAAIADDDMLKAITREIGQAARGNPSTRIYQHFGTPAQVRTTNTFNCFPSRYWQSGQLENWENLTADYMQANFEVKACGCPTCMLRCTKHSKVLHGRHAGLELEGPEFETIYALGGLNAIDSLEEVAWLNVLCDRLGLDTMSAGNISAFAIEAYKHGRIDFPIDYGQPDRVAELFKMIAEAEGVGAVFAKGIKSAARELDLEDIAIHVKGLEPAGFDPRVLRGMGLSYATSARGACHLRGTFYKAELSGQIDPKQIEGKAELHIDYEDRAALFDCLVLCRFYRDLIGWDELVAIYEALTGIKRDQQQLQLLANHITQETRRYNHREGLLASADTLPRRFLREKTSEGYALSEAELKTMIDDYNAIREQREKLFTHQI